MHKIGFIYLWYDKKHKRYYLGCHWGTEDDGYICSSRWMRNSFRRRQLDFKRRIIQRNISKENLAEEEYKWLQQIKDEELGKRYYNLRNQKWGQCLDKKVLGDKISKALKGKYIGENNWNFGKQRTEETKAKMRANHTRPMLGKKLSEETKKKISAAHLGIQKSKKSVKKSATTRTGTKRTEESKMKMSEAHKNMKKPWVKGRDVSKTYEITDIINQTTFIVKNLSKWCRDNKVSNNLIRRGRATGYTAIIMN